MAAIPDWKYDSEFNGYDVGCGELALNLRMHFQSLPEGAKALVISGDPGAPVDIPAWCRLIGNRLLESQHPYYLIQKKPEQNKPKPNKTNRNRTKQRSRNHG